MWSGYVGVSLCRGASCSSPQTTPFVLSVAGTGGSFRGSLEFQPFGDDVAVDVSGSAQPDGAVLFASTHHATAYDARTVTVRRLLVRTDPVAGLTGDLDMRLSGETSDVRGTVTSASFQPLSAFAAQGVSGSWHGLAIIRQCAGDCPSYRDAGDIVRIALVVGQAGEGANGQVQLSIFEGEPQWLDVHGTASQTTFSFASDRVALSSSCCDRMRFLQTFKGSLDDLGRIDGTFTYAADGRIAIKPYNISYRLECEVLWLVRDR
ncbi:MAG TPA: hypothetical protein VFK20_09685 [Vicinamibacterales bacterium]|nr:hypothetical protein [Vicinamibacterales bacterium]